MTKLSLSQIEDSFELLDDSAFCADMGEEVEEPLALAHEIDEACYRNTYQRKEIRSQRKREDGELVGKGDIRKHRKY